MADKREDKRDSKRDAKDAKAAPVAGVGEWVFYTPGKDEPTATENAAGLPALVVAAQESGTVTLVVFDSDGKVLVRRSVSAPVLDENGNPPVTGPYAMTELKDITPPEPVAPTLTSLTPDKVKLGSADFELECAGTGFTHTSVITFAGNPEPIRFYSPEMITTIVKPSLGWGEVTLPVTVKNGDLETAPLDFTFLAADPVPPEEPVTYPAPQPEPALAGTATLAGKSAAETKPKR